MNNSIPEFTVKELNAAIGNLLQRGFAPKFSLNATISKAQLKKGHLWLTLSDGESIITAVVWSSSLKKIKYKPNQGDGVIIIGKLNFWEVRANLIVQVFDISPSIATVIRKFEIVKKLLINEGLVNDNRKRNLPKYPKKIALLTSSPSSALADMLRTAKECWPLTKIFIVSIPVQGDVASKVQHILKKLKKKVKSLSIEVIVIARGGGNREDLMLFDDENLCRLIAGFPIPVVTGIGHEDDETVIDLVSDYSASTPTAAIVSVLPSRLSELDNCYQRRLRLGELRNWFFLKQRDLLFIKDKALNQLNPAFILTKYNDSLNHRKQLLSALSPSKWLKRGFSIVCDINGKPVNSINNLKKNQILHIEFSDGKIITHVDKLISGDDKDI